MNGAVAVVLLIEPGAWRIGLRGAPEQAAQWLEVPRGESQTPAALAAAAAKALEPLRYDGHPLVLAIPSAWCLATSVSTADLPRPRKTRHQTLLYRIEERLPLAAEDFVASYTPISAAKGSPTGATHLTPTSTDALSVGSTSPNDAETLGIAVSLERLAPLVEALEAAGIAIGTICPSTFLALQAYTSHLPAEVRVFWFLPDHLEALVLQGGVPRQWMLLESDASTLRRHLDLASSAGPPCVFVDSPVGLDPVAIVGPGKQASAISSGGAAGWAAKAAQAILAGRMTPWIDLRRDALATRDRYRMYRRPLNAVLAAGLALAVCLILGLAWQTHRYHQATTDLEARQAAIYGRLYPGTAVPLGIRARLQSETQRLRALNGQSGDLPGQESALVTLYEVLRRLPTDLRFRLLEVRFGVGEFALEGQTKSHGDADVLASALRRQNGFVMEPTRTEQLATGQVSFTLVGKSVANQEKKR